MRREAKSEGRNKANALASYLIDYLTPLHLLTLDQRMLGIRTRIYDRCVSDEK